MALEKIKLSDLRQTLKEPVDLFICSSSFEERCLSIAKNIEIGKINRALILANHKLLEHVGKHKEYLEQLFVNKGTAIDISIEDPLFTADNLDKSIQKFIGQVQVNSILIDITTFTHECLLILLRILGIRCSNAKITCVYANALEYSVGEEVKHKWLSKGIGEVRSVLGFPGNTVPSRKTHLILIVGYEYERAASLIEIIEPNSIALGYGRSASATTEKDKEANEHYILLVEQIASSYADIMRFEIPCNDPYKTRDELQAQIANVKDMNILIAPMNNKLSTIGAALAAFNNKDVQICYAQAVSYNYSNYSVPGSECYVFNLDLENIPTGFFKSEDCR